LDLLVHWRIFSCPLSQTNNATKALLVTQWSNISWRTGPWHRILLPGSQKYLLATMSDRDSLPMANNVRIRPERSRSPLQPQLRQPLLVTARRSADATLWPVGVGCVGFKPDVRTAAHQSADATNFRIRQWVQPRLLRSPK